MRIALLFSGQPRFVGAVAPNIIHNVIGDYNVDTFCHFWFDDELIAISMGLAMIANLLFAGVLGTLIPLTLEKFKIDPAISSSVFLTTATDVIGFFTFLGLSAIIIL